MDGMIELEDGRLRSAIRVGDWKLVLDEYCLSWFSPVAGEVGEERGRDVESTCNVTTCADPGANAPRGSYLFNLENDPYEEVSLGRCFRQATSNKQASKPANKQTTNK